MTRFAKLLCVFSLVAMIIPVSAQARVRTKCPAGMIDIGGAVCMDRYEYPNRKGEFAMNAATWDVAVNLCAKEGKRLCSSADWQAACSGPRGYKYPYGNGYVQGLCSDQYAEGGKGQYPSGAMSACESGYGAYDMSGNLWEWTSDVYDDGTRGIMGGSAATTDEGALACVNPSKENPSTVEDYIGFRCCAAITKAGERSQISPLVGYPPVRGEKPGPSLSADYFDANNIVNSNALSSYMDASGFNLTASYQFEDARLDFTRIDYNIKAKKFGVPYSDNAVANVMHGEVLLPLTINFGDWTGDLSAGVRLMHTSSGKIIEMYLLKELNNGRWSLAQAVNHVAFENGGKDRAGYSLDARYRLNRVFDIVGNYNYSDFYKGYINYYIVPESALAGILGCEGCKHQTGTAGFAYELPGDRGNVYLLYYDAGDMEIPMGGTTIKF